MDYVIGCLTHNGNPGLVRLHREGDALSVCETSSCIENPTFVCFSPDGRYLFAASEEASSPSEELLLQFDTESGLFHENARCLLEGHLPCYLSCDPLGRQVFAADYAGGTLTCFDYTQNSLKSVFRAHHHGRGSDPVRQEAAHVHQAIPNRAGDVLYAVDLGLDKVFSYIRDREDGTILDQYAADMPAGTGPRHLLLDEDRQMAYLCCELTSEVLILRMAGVSFELVGRISALPEGISNSTSWSGGIKRLGNRIYVSNRGYDSIAVFTVMEDGLLAPPEIVPVAVDFPRDFHVDPDGSMIVLGQRGGGINLYKPTEDGYKEVSHVPVEAPVCIVPVPAHK